MRLEQLKKWLQSSDIGYDDIQPASADASFRRYFRIYDNGKTYIVMDAPPGKEDCQSFIDIAEMLLRFGLHVPKILQQDIKQGFLLLSDLGNTVFLSELNNHNVDKMYSSAMDALLLLQQNTPVNLPAYDEKLLRTELNLFPDWYLEKQLKITVTESQKAVLEKVFDVLIQNALSQPQVYVHRDYHSRNLMVNKDHADKPGVIDFQDAVIGAVTYDLVSLLKDCYISWSREKVVLWVASFRVKAEYLGIIENVDAKQFLRWFDLMGLQRHLKVAGIFSRLKHRDGKTGYLKDIPRTMDYVFEVLELYPEFVDFKKLLRDVL